MHEILASRDLFFVREKVGMFKAVNEYDILDPETEELIMTSSEDIGLLSKIFRFTDYKTMTPFNVIVSDASGRQVLRVSRGISFFRSRVTVYDENDNPVGQFLQKIFSIGGAFRLLDMDGKEHGQLKGNWRSWDFSFVLPSGIPLGRVAKKWAGMGKELFTSADNYMLEIENSVEADNPLRMMILGAVMCIDMVLKE
jgi:uncharacterized protein YxjI